MVEINVPYETDIVKLEKMVENTLEILPEKYDIFVGTPVINGVQALELSNYVLRIRAETTPVMQWEGARVIRKEIDRKSTRLNSSHVASSYADFCLKKKI